MFARILADSININDERLFTFYLRYPFAIHQQVMTHRDFSRQGSSSRAMPTATIIQDVIDDPFIPLGMAFNQRGMVPGEELPPEVLQEAMLIHSEHRAFSILCAKRMEKLGVHKQWANGYLNFHRHIDMIVSMTRIDNFFNQRLAGDAREEIRVLAEMMKEAITKSDPTVKNDGEWHLPFIRSEEKAIWTLPQCIARSGARCARASYNKHDSSPATFEEDIVLYQGLILKQHMTPLEHQASADSSITEIDVRNCGNFFTGWRQHRKAVEQGLRLTF